MTRLRFSTLSKSCGWLVVATPLAIMVSGGPDAAVAQTVMQIPDIVVTAPPDQPADGTAAAGYRVDTATDVGPLGSRPIKDTPYSISVMSRDLLDNVQASTTDDVFRLHPFTFNMFPVTRDNPLFPMIRGFDASGATRDNMRLWNTGYVHLEGLERVEVINGPTGFLYGPTPPGGFIDYVQKNPTAAPYFSAKAGNIDAGGYGHVDVGGPVDKDGRVRARFNAAAQEGGTAIDQQKVSRHFVSGAVDFLPTDDLLIQLRAFDGYYRAEGQEPFWNFFGGALYPSAPDARKLWGQPWGYVVDQETGTNARVKWNVNDVFTVRTGYSYIKGRNEFLGINNNVGSNSGTYEQDMIANAPAYLTTESGYGALDAAFATGPLRHKVSLGVSWLDYRNETANDPFAFVSLGTSFNFIDPTYVSQPSFTIGTRPVTTFFTRGNRNAFVADTIDIGSQWSTIVGVNRANVFADVNDYIPPPGQARTQQSAYDETRVSPTASLIYKPTSWLSLYGTYIEGLEEGAIAASYAANAGTIFPPNVSKQYEVGAKMSLERTFVTLAAFDITKGYTFYDGGDNTFKDGGRQRNKGIELSVSGKVTDSLTLFGGATWIRARVENDRDPALGTIDLSGLVPVNVPNQMYKLYAEYALPYINGLTLTGGVFYTGPFTPFATNDQFLPGVVTADLGFRYETKIGNTPVISRFNVTNITDESYWMSQRFVGRPRTFALSVEAKF